MELGFSLATYIVLALTVLYILHLLTNKKNSIPNFPPGPPPLPIIGNLHIINPGNPQFTYLELAKKYGPIFSIQTGMKKIVVLTGYEVVKDALFNHAEEFGERGKTKIFQEIDKNMGVVHARGENWKVMRRFTLTTLRDFGMGKSSIEEKIIEESGYAVKYIEAFKGKPFDNSLIMNAAVANIIVSILLGYRMDFEDAQFLRLLTLMNEYIKLLGDRMVGIYNIFPFLGFLPGSHKTFIKNVEEICNFISESFVEPLKNLDENDQKGLIDAFLVQQKKEAGNPNSYFHNGNLTRLARNLFSAGIETTTSTLQWGLLLMMTYPDIQEKVQEEISRVIGSAQPLYSHRTQMPYTNAVVHEIQRFADIVPLSIPHETTKDITFRGYFIPKETYIIPLLSSVLKDKTQFKKPDEFDPNHFLDSEGNFVKKDAFMPFSAGQRVCIGETLARMELFIFFTSMLQKFTFHFPPGINAWDLTPGVGFTNMPKQHPTCASPRF
ncbi:cytochrome P450 2K1-like [Gastrophryne carolinensis]